MSRLATKAFWVIVLQKIFWVICRNLSGSYAERCLGHHSAQNLLGHHSAEIEHSGSSFYKKRSGSSICTKRVTRQQLQFRYQSYETVKKKKKKKKSNSYRLPDRAENQKKIKLFRHHFSSKTESRKRPLAHLRLALRWSSRASSHCQE